MKITEEKRKQDQELFHSLLNDERLAFLKKYTTHIHSTRYFHVKKVTETALRWAYKLPFKKDTSSLIVGGLLHDYYDYSPKNKNEKWHKHHWFRHPKYAYEKASKVFDLNKKEKDIILHHMWPITFFLFPRSKEAWLVCFADTHVALIEWWENRTRLAKRRAKSLKRYSKKQSKVSKKQTASNHTTNN